ncbi:two-component system sensor histidine kinase KdpD [Hydrogenispora ethanolica]|jgi:two-component system sensor histidine kinase KdpD|uniref:Two-component system sensor histidine kinase KdpD n=1 Tax=Hydrogenispora ethanolica TaxID=1082276 RepID=A0A4R1SBF5_HYDET|nr:universal stress protein [Hydrogenispora ethanolica]TCL76831.1 two-component system sensor histidine kinase KdpD [Hydrogenispora ethanolica]
MNQREAGAAPGRGKLKIFIGYAPGVGKTCAMLNEAQRRAERGQDVVVGYVETHGRPETAAQIGGLEVLDRLRLEHEGTVLEELDSAALLARGPELAVIDDLAHPSAPGARHARRYEDVLELLDQGISVLTTLDIGQLESLNDVVREITGLTVAETVPDRIVDAAAAVVVDITPDALLNRLQRGAIYPLERISPAVKNFFRPGNLNALRELALRHAAEEADEDLEAYLAEQGIRANWQAAERVMVCIAAGPTAKMLIRRGARIAKRYRCEWLVVYVECTHRFAPPLTPGDRERLEGHFKLARQLGAEIVVLRGQSVSAALAGLAQERHVTQIVIGHSRRSGLQTLLRGSTIYKLLRQVSDVAVHVIPTAGREG